MEIYASQYGVLTEVLARGNIDPAEVAAIGITNQRETTILWDRKTGRPVYNAIVWQCRRTADICEDLKKQGLEEYIRENTGLLIDAYFSGTKIKWILDLSLIHILVVNWMWPVAVLETVDNKILPYFNAITVKNKPTTESSKQRMDRGSSNS